MRVSVIILTASLGAGVALAEFGGSYLVPLDHEAIQYSKAPVDDPIARLGRRIAQGEVKFEFENNGMGHLRSLLKNLGVSIDSQVLVFSKTSFQGPLISPRSLYFGDNVSVGWVRGGGLGDCARHKAASAGILALSPAQDFLHFRIGDLAEISVPFAHGEERLRGGQANALVGFLSESAACLGRRHGHRDNYLLGTCGAHMTDGREHCRSGRQSIINQNYGAARESGRWTVTPV